MLRENDRFLTPKSFAEQLLSTSKRLSSKVDSLISDPSAENVHDTRTTIRRAQALFRLLPKNLRRKGKAARFLKSSKRVFRATSQIRDIDVTEVKLKQFETYTGFPEFFGLQKEKRVSLLRSGTKSFQTLKRTTIPRFKLSQISDSKLSRRENKVVGKLQVQLKSQVAIILGNPTEEQLHDFRKACKMLRYTLEVDSRKNKEGLALLKKMQEIFGTLLDNYTSLRYLSESSLGNSAKPIVEKLTSENEAARAALEQMLKEEFRTILEEQKIAN